MKRTPTAPPPTGPPRLAWWNAWRSAIAHDALWSAQRSIEHGWTADDVDDHLDHYRQWVVGQLDLAVEEGRLLGRWWSA